MSVGMSTTPTAPDRAHTAPGLGYRSTAPTPLKGGRGIGSAETTEKKTEQKGCNS